LNEIERKPYKMRYIYLPILFGFWWTATGLLLCLLWKVCFSVGLGLPAMTPIQGIAVMSVRGVYKMIRELLDDS
jgi:hypothetical protein